MGGLFGRPKAPKAKEKIIAAPAPVTQESEAAKAERQRKEADEEERRRRAGLASNTIFGGSDTSSGSQGPKKLLGQ